MAKVGNPYHDAKGLFTSSSGDADGKPVKRGLFKTSPHLSSAEVAARYRKRFPQTAGQRAEKEETNRKIEEFLRRRK